MAGRVNERAPITPLAILLLYRLMTLHHYYVFDVKMQAIREVFSSADLTSTAGVPH